MRKGAQTLVFGSKPVILSRAAIGGKKKKARAAGGIF